MESNRGNVSPESVTRTFKNVAAKHMQSVHEVWQTDVDPFSKLVVVDTEKLLSCRE